MDGDLFNELSIDIAFLKEMQGKPISTGYVPDSSDSQQGVRVANGFNLGQSSLQQLRKMNFSPILVGKLYPYLGKTGDEARLYLKDFPLRLSENEVNIISNEILMKSIESLVTKYNEDAQEPFQTIPKYWQTVISSIYLQYEDLPNRFPEFWSLVTLRNWQSALEMLRNFNDKHIARRNAEADYIELFI